MKTWTHHIDQSSTTYMWDVLWVTVDYVRSGSHSLVGSELYEYSYSMILEGLTPHTRILKWWLLHSLTIHCKTLEWHHHIIKYIQSCAGVCWVARWWLCEVRESGVTSRECNRNSGHTMQPTNQQLYLDKQPINNSGHTTQLFSNSGHTVEPVVGFLVSTLIPGYLISE